MRAAPTVLTLSFAAGLLAAGSADAMGFGKVANATQLGQRLNFAALVRLEPDESLDRACVFAEVMAGDNRLQPGQIRVTLEGGPDDPDRIVRVTTSTVIDEPVVTVSVTVGCASRVTRKFVAFIDPPGIELAQSAPAEAPLLVPQRADSQLAPLLAIVAPEAPRRGVRSSPQMMPGDRRPPSQGTESGPARRRAAADPGDRRVVMNHKPAPLRQASAAPRPPGARLQLEAAPLLAARAVAAASAPVPAVAAVSVSVPEAASAPVADPRVDLLVRQQQQLQTLEAGMSRLRADSVATQKALAGLQSRLLEAEAERYANPLVYALGGLCALLALGLAALLRRSRGRRATQWWAAPAAADPVARTARRELLDDPTPLEVPAPVVPPGVPVRAEAPRAVDVSLPGVFSHSAAEIAAIAAKAPVLTVSVPLPLAKPPAAEAPFESSVEEMIDLEQQAEFFIVLGQDDAAVDLLTSHVRSDGGRSPLPYLKLLEIHHRRGDEVAYAAIRENFNRRFNAYAPDWHGDPQEGRSLEEYPEVIGLLQRLWGTPSRAMEALDASVLRRGKSDAPFDLPAYRELLFLYSIARDRAEQGDPASPDGVDLLLPLEAAAHLDPSLDVPLAVPIDKAVDVAVDLPLDLPPNPQGGRRLDFQNSDFVTAPLDLDVSFPEPATRAGTALKPTGARRSPALPAFDSTETVPSALRRPTGYAGESAFVDLELEPVGLSLPDGVR